MKSSNLEPGIHADEEGKPSFILIEDVEDIKGRVWFQHNCNGEFSGGTLPNAKWQVIKKVPLTVHPSINCVSCGLHGWIEEDKWVSAQLLLEQVESKLR